MDDFTTSLARLDYERIIQTTEKLISLSQLRGRWRGATEFDFITLERIGELFPYIRQKSVKNPATREVIHFLYPCTIIEYSDWNGGTYSLCNEDCQAVFIESNIVEIEKERPDFLCQIFNDELIESASQIQNNDNPALQTEDINRYDNKIACLQNELAEANNKIAELQEKLAILEKEKSYKPYGLIKHIMESRQKGESDKQIARRLNKTTDLSRPAIGAIFRTEDNIITDYGHWADRLLKD